MKKEQTMDVAQNPETGLVWFKNKWLHFTEFTKVEKGKGAGKIKIVLRDKPVFFRPEEIKRFPPQNTINEEKLPEPSAPVSEESPKPDDPVCKPPKRRKRKKKQPVEEEMVQKVEIDEEAERNKKIIVEFVRDFSVKLQSEMERILSILK